jgi:hypothetical protein
VPRSIRIRRSPAEPGQRLPQRERPTLAAPRALSSAAAVPCGIGLALINDGGEIHVPIEAPLGKGIGKATADAILQLFGGRHREPISALAFNERCRLPECGVDISSQQSGARYLFTPAVHRPVIGRPERRMT